MVVTKIDPRVYTYYLSADKNDPNIHPVCGLSLYLTAVPGF